ncbi:MAG TPA: permease-like cell division protein FtsX [Pseudomonadales bacterium]|nr:permease-like cell division protein FtsX [Pseudomonadales bacterium]
MSSDPWSIAGSRSTGRAARWMRDHQRVARDSLIFVSQRFWTSALVWLLIGIALALPGGLYLVQTNLAAMSDRWEGRPGITVYLQVDADAQVGRALRDQLSEDPDVERVTLIGADAALAEFEKFTGVTDALAHLKRNPLPASLRVVMKGDTRPEQFEALATRLRAEAGVDEVSVEKTWLERVQAMTAVVRRMSWVLAATFAVGAILVTATSVRLAIEARLAELQVMKLVGATDSYIRRPFLYFGLLYGLGGGIAGAMLISAVLGILEAPLAALLGSYGQSLDPRGLNAAFFGVLVFSGGALGIAGALLAARQRLTHLQIL